MRSQLLKPIDAKTASYTSEPINIEGAEKISLMFKRSNHSAGASAFKAQVSVNGDDFIDYNKLIDNVVNAIAEGEVRVGSASLASDTFKIYTMDLSKDIFKKMRLVVTETTDGTHDAWALIGYKDSN